ncbi:MAG: ABC transporter substrate-binding protein [Chlorobi bacterium]|nr:ABC transporter substrate-binding protein [Chlorobiota bacterium]
MFKIKNLALLAISTVILIVTFSTFITITAISITGCGGKKTQQNTQNGTVTELMPAVDTSEAVTGDWIIQREMADAEKLNPIVSNDATADEIAGYIFETLNNFDLDKWEMVPKLASLPTESPDHLSYTYDLRKDIKFSDGKPMTGEDVIFTIKALKNPFVDDAALRNYFEAVEKVELVDGDKYKFKFIMNRPYWRMMYSIGLFKGIMPKHIIDPKGLTDKYTWDEVKDFKAAEKNPAIKEFAEWMNSQEVARDPKLVVGSGWYVLDKWDLGQAITLKRNPNYWRHEGIQDAKTYVEKIVFKIVQDNNAAVVSAKNKEVDLLYVISPRDYVQEFQDPAKYDLMKVTPQEPVFSYIGWNNNNVLFSDKKVRRALGMLIERQTIIDKILYGFATPVNSPIYYKDKKYYNEKLPQLAYDPEGAKKLLEEAGWKDSNGDGLLDKVIGGKKVDFKFTFLNNNNPTRRQIVLAVIDMLKKAGIQAEVQDLEWSVYLDKTKKHEFDATLGAWTMPVIPQDPYQLWHSSQSKGEGSNFCSFINSESDKMIEQIRDEFDESKRIEIMKKWQELIFEEQPYTFMYSGQARYVFGNRFKNVRWYPAQPSYSLNEWWVPKNLQKFTQTMN